MTGNDLVTHLTRFATALRTRGVPVGLAEELDAARALTVVDLVDVAEVRRALRIAFRIRPGDRVAFDELFTRIWLEGGEARPPDAARARAPLASDHRGPPRWSWDGRRVTLAQPESEQSAPSSADLPGYSPLAVLRRKPFDECSPRELAAMERVVARLVRRLATRRSRRLVPSRGRGITDLRRSLRRAVGTGGEVVRLARRAPALERPKLVVLCDTSGSMDPHTRFLLTFLLSLRQVARRAEVFAFNTSLRRLTPWLSPREIGSTLDRLAAGVPDWSGGTKIGATLAEFVSRYQNSMVDARTVVVIVSDGLDQGDTELLERTMQAMRRRARKLIWLNPLLGDERYEPTARGMAAALPFVDDFAPAHNLESLEHLLTLVST